MNSSKQPWEEYKQRLEKYGYSPEQIEEVYKIRHGENYEDCSFEQWKELVRIGVIERSRKLKKPRNLRVDENGIVWYLEHVYKTYNFCGRFKNEE